MNREEIKSAFQKCDRKTKECIFAYLIDILNSEEIDQLSRFMELIV